MTNHTMVFYRNEEVEYYSDINDTTALIRITIPRMVDRGDYLTPEYWEPDYMFLEVPKKELYNEKINLFKEYETKRVELENELNEIKKDINKNKKEYEIEQKEIESKRIKYKEMDTLFKFLDDKINYMVDFDSFYGTYEIKTLKDGLNDNKSYGRDTRLVSLFGKSNGKLNYRVNSYSDGSGNDDIYNFFETEEQSILAIKNDIIKRIESGEKLNNINSEKLKGLKEKFNINSEIVDNEIKSLKEKEINNIKNDIKEKQNSINNKILEIEKLEKECGE